MDELNKSLAARIKQLQQNFGVDPDAFWSAQPPNIRALAKSAGIQFSIERSTLNVMCPTRGGGRFIVAKMNIPEGMSVTYWVKR